MPVFCKSTRAQILSSGTEFFLSDLYETNYEIAIVSKDTATVSFHFFATPSQDFQVKVLPGKVSFVKIPAGFASFAGGHIGGIIDNRSLRICSDKNIVVTGHVDSAFVDDATLIYPVSQPFLKSDTLFSIGANGNNVDYFRGFVLVSHYDSVVLEITLTEEIRTMFPKDIPFVITLNTGETFTIMDQLVSGAWSTRDYNGTQIRVLSTQKNNPISLFASSFAFPVFPMDSNMATCCFDQVFEQLLPTSTWDTLFHIVPSFLMTSDTTGYKPVIIRVASAANNNKVYIDNVLAATLNYGKVFDTLLPSASIVRSDFPISVNQFFLGLTYITKTAVGDPDQLWLSPLKMGIREAIFQTFPRIKSTNIRTNSTISYLSALTLITDSSSFNITLDGRDISSQFRPFPSDYRYCYAQLLLPDTSTSSYHLRSNKNVIAYVSAMYEAGGVSYALGDLSPYDEQLPQVSLLDFCDSIQLHGKKDANAYLWSTGKHNMEESFSSGGTYWVTSYYRCASITDTFHLNLIPPIPNLLSKDTFICEGTSIILDAYHEYFTNYAWSTGDTTASINIATPGIYIVHAYSELCSGIIDTIVIGMPETPILTLPGDTLLCRGTILQLGKPITGVTFSWNRGDTTCCIDISKEGYYQVIVSNFCDSIIRGISVNYQGCDSCLLVPNAFTPNGDGRNDLFKITTDCRFSSFILDIYNRYGQRVYSSPDVGEGWDGFFQGIPSETGVYFYQIKVITQLLQETIYRKGDISLIR